MKIYVSYDIFSASATSESGNPGNFPSADDEKLMEKRRRRNHFNAAFGRELFMMIIFDIKNDKVISEVHLSFNAVWHFDSIILNHCFFLFPLQHQDYRVIMAGSLSSDSIFRCIRI